MTLALLERQTLDKARVIAGSDDPVAVQTTLVRMVLQATHGASAGFLRLPPAREVSLDIKGQTAIDEDRGGAR